MYKFINFWINYLRLTLRIIAFYVYTPFIVLYVGKKSICGIYVGKQKTRKENKEERKDMSKNTLQRMGSFMKLNSTLKTH